MPLAMSRKTRGLMALLATTILWGSSFPAINIIMYSVHEYTYTWLRSLVALTGLFPYVLYRLFSQSRISARVVKGGLLAGIAYALGLWLQGWGTRYTTASNSAFITGLNVVFVHVYTAVILRKYSIRQGIALLLAITGLYMLTKPSTGFNIGDFLVLLGAFMWALQVIIVDKYSVGSDPLVFTFFEMIPALLFLIPDYFTGITLPPLNSLLLIIYLGLVCSDAAFTLQVYGQKYIVPSYAAIIYLLEPVFASIFAYIVLAETMVALQVVGAALILSSMFLASTEEIIVKNNTS